MPSDGKKGITVKIDAELHAEVRQYVEQHEMTMAEFVALALTDELHPKINQKEGQIMGNMRTLAFQVPEALFQRIKEYLQRNNMTQKEFVIGLIETELERDMAERESVSDAQTDDSEQAEEDTEQEETAAVGDFETVSEEATEDTEEQTDSDFLDEFEGENEEYEDEDEDYDEGYDDSSDDENESEDEEQGFSMGM